MTFERAAKLLLSHDYKFAKTMPTNPHWYTLREKWNSKDFEDVVKFIREKGYFEGFYGKFYKMFNLNGYKYWTMGAPLDDTILINKAKVFYWSDYDDIAEDYEKMWNTPEGKAEDKELIKLLDIKGKVLDIGCGTGMLLENVKIADYTGIDLSQGMLNILTRKFPDYKDKVINCGIADFYGEKYDTILALYGTSGYFTPEDRLKVRKMLKKGGKAYLMDYKAGYIPVTHIKAKIDPIIYRYDNEKGIEFGNYNIVVYENL